MKEDKPVVEKGNNSPEIGWDLDLEFRGP